MEIIDVGIISLLPPILAIVLALITKEVIISLIIGILAGTFTYSIYTVDGFFTIFTKTFDVTISLMVEKLAANASIIIFLALLGVLVMVVTKAGGSSAYGDWASKKIKTKSGAKFSTFVLGVLIFIDDYFNCLTVGTVMSPITDKHGISRQKLAYLIDATAAPICIIAPVSSWAASIISQLNDSGLNGIQAFVQTIPYNLYAIFTIIFVLIICFTNIDFGIMAKFENAKDKNKYDNTYKGEPESDLEISKKGKVIDLIIPIAVLILTSVLAMLYVGGYFSQDITIAEAFGNTDAGLALSISGFITLIITFFLIVGRRVISFKDFMGCVSSGIKSMVPAYIILILAWTISGVCRDLLNTGAFALELFSRFNISLALIPAIGFIIAGILSFSMGTSWGTFSILIPIIIAITSEAEYSLTIISLSAVLAGSVFGDHCSLISDTTILSSAGAKCDHMSHVSSQMPYALVVGGASLIGYLVAGFTDNLLIIWGICLIIILALVVFFYKKES